MRKLDKQQIKTILPHREPMLLLDSVEKQGNKSKGYYTVRGDEFFLQGHFPGNPVVPGVILCEMLAQACCVLMADKSNNALPLFTSLNNVKFKRMVVPGDTVELNCEIVKQRNMFYFAKGVGTVDGKTAVIAEFSFALVQKP